MAASDETGNDGAAADSTRGEDGGGGSGGESGIRIDFITMLEQR